MALDNLARELDHAASRQDDEAEMGKTLRRTLIGLLLIVGGMLGATWRVAQS